MRARSGAFKRTECPINDMLYPFLKRGTGPDMERRSLAERRALLLDGIAIGLSGLCLAHCVGTAILLAVLATAAGPFLDPRVHEFGLALAILLAAIALGRGMMTHRRMFPLATGGVGLLLMGAALMVPHGPAEIVLTMIGVGFLATAHYANYRASR